MHDITDEVLKTAEELVSVIFAIKEVENLQSSNSRDLLKIEEYKSKINNKLLLLEKPELFSIDFMRRSAKLENRTLLEFFVLHGFAQLFCQAARFYNVQSKSKNPEKRVAHASFILEIASNLKCDEMADIMLEKTEADPFLEFTREGSRKKRCAFSSAVKLNDIPSIRKFLMNARPHGSVVEMEIKKLSAQSNRVQIRVFGASGEQDTLHKLLEHKWSEKIAQDRPEMERLLSTCSFFQKAIESQEIEEMGAHLEDAYQKDTKLVFSTLEPHLKRFIQEVKNKSEDKKYEYVIRFIKFFYNSPKYNWNFHKKCFDRVRNLLQNESDPIFQEIKDVLATYKFFYSSPSASHVASPVLPARLSASAPVPRFINEFNSRSQQTGKAAVKHKSNEDDWSDDYGSDGELSEDSGCFDTDGSSEDESLDFPSSPKK